MGKMKEVYAHLVNHPDLKFIDDTYRYQIWQENKIKFGDPPPVSDCCSASVLMFSKIDKYICTNCMEECQIR